MVNGKLLNQWRFRRCILISISVSALVVIYVHVNNGAWVKNFLGQDATVTHRPESPLARDKLKIIKKTLIMEQTSSAAVFAKGDSEIKISNELKEFFKPFGAKNNAKQTKLTQKVPINELKLDKSKYIDINTINVNQEIKRDDIKDFDTKKEVSKDIATISDGAKMPENNKLFDKRPEPVIKTIKRTGSFDIDPWLKVPYIAPMKMLNATKLSKNDNYKKELLKKARPIPRPSQKTLSPMIVQGVRQGPLVRTQMRIPFNLTKEVFIFEVMRESREERHSVKDNKCVLLKSYFVTSPICVYDPIEDEVISATLMKQQTWEPNLLYVAGRILTNNMELKFLDLGCNLGVYTILAAKLGIDVIAVDPSKQNLRLLTKALSLGGLRSKVTMLWNAISNVHEKVTLTDIVGNAGGAFVETVDGSQTNNANAVQTILLDDLIPFFKDNSVFIKMDVETYEWKALEGADKFFSQIDVAYVLMEWSYHKEHGDGQEIIDFMYKRGLYPHINANYNTQLDKDVYQTWPDNVLWIKYSNILVE